jgi:flagellar biosynthesis protein FliQ
VADILNSISREITALAVGDDDNLRGAGIGSVAVLCVVSLMVFPVILLFLIYHACNPTNPELPAVCRRFIIALVQSFAAGLYFYGDNINYIMQRYSDALGCGDQCVTNNRIAAVISLGIALIMFQLFPLALSKFYHIVEWEDKRSTWYSSLDMITVYVKVDIVYTAIAVMTQTDAFCSHTDLTLSASFIIICILVGLAIMIIDCLYSIKETSGGNDPTANKVCLIGACVPLAFGFILYMLADNEQPMDCGLNCDTFAANQTMNDLDCDARTNSGLRLGFMLVTLIIVVVGALLFTIAVLSKDDETDGKRDKSGAV